jgi:hypothetical protein
VLDLAVREEENKKGPAHARQSWDTIQRKPECAHVHPILLQPPSQPKELDRFTCRMIEGISSSSISLSILDSVRFDLFDRAVDTFSTYFSPCPFGSRQPYRQNILFFSQPLLLVKKTDLYSENKTKMHKTLLKP